MINKSDVFTIHKLWNQGFTKRQIAGKLQLDRGTVIKYLVSPTPTIQKRRVKQSKLDPYRAMVEEMVDQCKIVKAPVVLQRLIEKGFDCEITIVRGLLRKLRGQMANREPFNRFETEPGEQIQVDWGHFGSLPDHGPLVESCTLLLCWKAIVVCSPSTSLTVSNNHLCTRDYLMRLITLVVYPKRLWWIICSQQ